MIKEFYEDYKNWILGIFTLLIIIVSFLTLNLGFYIDENGLLAIYKGIYQGQQMFKDSWEALQTGGFLAYPLLALYFKILEPIFVANSINIGYVLFMRIAYMLARLIVACYLFYTIRHSRYANGAYPAALFYYIFVIAWKNFSYKSYCDMAIMLIICFILRFYETKQVRYWVFIGLAACVSILAYPTMIFFAVIMGIFIIVLIREYDVTAKTLLAFLLTCIISGLGFLTYLQCTTGIPQALSQITNFGDQDYEDSLIMRLGTMGLSYIVFAVIAYAPILFFFIIKKFRSIYKRTEHILLTLYWLLFFMAICLLRPDSISTSRFIYGILILFFWFPYFMSETQEKGVVHIGSQGTKDVAGRNLLWTVFILSAAAQLIWSCSTNQDISVPGHMALYVVIADIILFADADISMKHLTRILLLVALFFMAFWVPEGNGGYSDVLESRYIVTEGAYKGIALSQEDYEMNEASYKLVSDYVPAESKLLVAFGSNSTGYLNSEAMQAAYSPFARTQINSKLLDYYELNPQNQADYIIIDESHAKYEAFREGETGLWILENYTREIAREGNFVVLTK